MASPWLAAGGNLHAWALICKTPPEGFGTCTAARFQWHLLMPSWFAGMDAGA